MMSHRFQPISETWLASARNLFSDNLRLAWAMVSTPLVGGVWMLPAPWLSVFEELLAMMGRCCFC